MSSEYECSEISFAINVKWAEQSPNLCMYILYYQFKSTTVIFVFFFYLISLWLIRIFILLFLIFDGVNRYFIFISVSIICYIEILIWNSSIFVQCNQGVSIQILLLQPFPVPSTKKYFLNNHNMMMDIFYLAIFIICCTNKRQFVLADILVFTKDTNQVQFWTIICKCSMKIIIFYSCSTNSVTYQPGLDGSYHQMDCILVQFLAITMAVQTWILHQMKTVTWNGVF